MPKTYLNVTGMWQRDTQRGSVISAKLTQETCQKLQDAINDPNAVAMGELVIFVNDKRKHDKSPTHNLVIAINDEASVPSKSSDGAAPARRPVNSGPGDDNGIPF